MKKLNNKGFAISSLLYGLMLVAFLIVSILISIMSTNRKNTSTLVKKIEEELNRYSQTATELSSTDGTQEFIVPYGKAGWYKIELWGAAARGAQTEPESENGRGAYTSGIIYLDENTHLYFQIGSQGGSGGTKNNIDNDYGGGATDVRLMGGHWSDDTAEATRIMTAAGGSYGSANDRKGTGAGYGEGYYYSYKYPNGLYDGGSFIAGYPGQSPMSYTDPTTLENKTYAFLSTMMVPAVNAGEGKAKIELISTQGPDNPPAKKTTKLNGIQYIKNCIKYTSGQEKEVWREIVVIGKNGENLAKNKTIKYGSSATALSAFKDVSGFTDGSLNPITATKKTAEATLKVGTYYDVCIYLDLGSREDVEEIRIFHSNPDHAGITAHYSTDIITVQGASSAITLRNPTTVAQTPIETYLGVRISDRIPEVNAGETLPTGNYYIQSALSDNRFLTVEDGVAEIALFSGSDLQRWSISPVGTLEYKILDGATQMALQPQDGGQEIGEFIKLVSKYGEHNWEKWSIEPVSSKNGYYIFRSLGDAADMCLAMEGSSRNTTYTLKTAVCEETHENQWFKLVSADY